VSNNPHTIERRNHLRRAILATEKHRTEHRERHPTDNHGYRDYGRSITLMAYELERIGGGSHRAKDFLTRSD
jgi:hypothetical protein